MRARSVWALLAFLLLLGSASRLEAAEQVDINRASIVELMRLPGIGARRAEDIVSRREARPFKRVSDLLRIHGIGRRTFRKLKPLVTVTPPTPRVELPTAGP